MRFRPKTPYFWHVTLAAGVVFLVKALFIASKTVRELGMVPWIIDDSFIEMAVARNIALGHGFSYDWIHPTTGSPFLWTYLTSLNHLLFDRDIAIKATLIDSAFFGALCTIVTYAITHAVTGRSAIAWTAFILTTLTGVTFFNGLNGMETTFFTLFCLLTIGAYMGVGKPGNWSPYAWGCIVGLFGGIAILIRADGIFICAAIFCVQLLEIFRAKRAMERSSAIKYLLGMITTGLACLLLLVTYNLIATGSPSPANQSGRRELALSLHGFTYENFTIPRYVKIVLWNILQLEVLVSIAVGSSLLALIALIHGSFGSIEQNMRRLAAVSALYIVFFFGMLVAYQWYFPDFHGLRYLNPMAHLVWIFIASLLFSQTFSRWRTAGVTLIVVAMIGLSWTSFRALTQKMPWAVNMDFAVNPTEEEQAAFWRPIDWIAEHLPEDALIGVRDHGRMALFSGRPIQDLAGNIDINAPGHVKNGTLAEYLRERGVDYLFIPTLEQRSDAVYQEIYDTMNLKPVEGAPKDRAATLYEIVWE